MTRQARDYPNAYNTPQPAGAISPDAPIDQARDPVENAVVDPDEAQFRADAILMHGELLELELYKIRRELFRDPDTIKIQVGAGQPVEQTIRGYQADPFNGVIVYNPTPVTLAVGFQAGSGLLAPATVPPFSFATFPTRYVNLSIALLSPVDAQTTVTQPVTIMRTRIPPPPNAGPFTSPAPPQPFQSLTNASAAGAAGQGAPLDLGYPRAQHSLMALASAGVTGGVVTLKVSHDGVNWVGTGTTSAMTNSGVWSTKQADYPARYIRADVTTAVVGGTVSATVASV